MTTTSEWRKMCAELLGIFEKYDDESNLGGIVWDMKMDGNDLLERARAALAQPEPQPWTYSFPDGTRGCVMAYNKAHAIASIAELNPSQSLLCLSLHLEPEWTSNPLCDSQAANTCPTQRS
jgi:hypothetical protein